MTHVLQIVKGLDIGGVNGGAERFGIDLALALERQRGYKVSLCIFFKMDSSIAIYWEEKLKKSGISFFYATIWEGNDKFYNYWRGFQTTKRYAKQNKIDIANSHFQLGTIVVLALKFLGLIKIAVRTAHNNPIKEWSSGWYGRIRRDVFSNWIFPLGLDKEIGVSEEIVQQLSAHPGARLMNKQASLIHNAIIFNANKPQPGLVSHQEQIIGTVGRLSLQKNHRLLLLATKLLVSDYPNIKVWIIGDGELRDELVSLVEQLGITRNVVFWGSRQDVYELLSQMTLFVLTSSWEGLPTVVLESMACGIPVVSTDIPGVRELIKHGQNGWIVPGFDPAILAKQVRNVLSNSDILKTISEKAYLDLEKFSIETASKLYDDLYKGL